MRPVVLGNQRLLVNLDKNGFVRDIFYKRVGQENHVLGREHKVGVWAEFTLSWLDDPGWVVTMEADGTLATKTTYRNEERDLTITVEDTVLKEHDVFIRRYRANRHVRLFVYHYFFLYGDGIGDTAGYDPVRTMLFHYKRKRYFAMNAFDGAKSVLADYTIGSPMGEQHAWRDAYDGELSKNPIAQGHVDSCVAFNVLEDQAVDYVVCVARDFTSMRILHDLIATADRTKLIAESNAEDRAYGTLPSFCEGMKPEWKRIALASVLLIRAHTDTEGAITAGNDSENMLFNRDTYSYAWGRDNAIIARAMDLAGKHELTRSYYGFMQNVIEPEGYYMHKHHPDGSLGSSWQAWIRDGKPYLPIQEDETALQLWSLKAHHDTANDDFVNGKYEWIAKMTDFLLGFMHEDMPLPRDCWDLWEERQGIHTWTVASVIAGLRAGAFFARQHDDESRARAAEDLATRMTDAMLQYLTVTETPLPSTTSTATEGKGKKKGAKEKEAAGKESKEVPSTPPRTRFIRRLTPELVRDETVDAADLAPFILGVLPHDHPVVVNTVATIEEKLRTPDGGIARYQGDYFHRKTEDAPGNPWVMCTLWIANWHIMQRNWKRADELIDWVAHHAVGANLLGEQMHPLTGEPLAVCPLTQAHAQFLDTVFLYMKTRASEGTKG